MITDEDTKFLGMLPRSFECKYEEVGGYFKEYILRSSCTSDITAMIYYSPKHILSLDHGTFSSFHTIRTYYKGRWYGAAYSSPGKIVKNSKPSEGIEIFTKFTSTTEYDLSGYYKSINAMYPYAPVLSGKYYLLSLNVSIGPKTDVTIYGMNYMPIVEIQRASTRHDPILISFKEIVTYLV